MIQGKGAKNGYLSAYSPKEVIRRLIDSYRLRVEIDHLHRSEDHGIYYPGQWEEGIVWVKGDVVEDFQHYLGMAEGAGVLPKWWAFENRMECISLAIDRNDDENIFTPLNQSEMIANYGGDMEVRCALVVLAELVVGYEGKGAAQDGTWYEVFVDHLEQNPEEKARLIEGSVAAVEAACRENGRSFPPMPQSI